MAFFYPDFQVIHMPWTPLIQDRIEFKTIIDYRIALILARILIYLKQELNNLAKKVENFSKSFSYVDKTNIDFSRSGVIRRNCINGPEL